MSVRVVVGLLAAAGAVGLITSGPPDAAAGPTTRRGTPPVAGLACPLHGPVHITSPYGPRAGTLHDGADLRARTGTRVYALTAGRVLHAGVGDPGGYGRYVRTTRPRAGHVDYGHLSRVAVRTGQYVKAGQLLGWSGKAGSSTGPHLHVRVNAGGAVGVDPAPTLARAGCRIQ